MMLFGRSSHYIQYYTCESDIKWYNKNAEQRKMPEESNAQEQAIRAK